MQNRAPRPRSSRARCGARHSRSECRQPAVYARRLRQSTAARALERGHPQCRGVRSSLPTRAPVTPGRLGMTAARAARARTVTHPGDRSRGARVDRLHIAVAPGRAPLRRGLRAGAAAGRVDRELGPDCSQVVGDHADQFFCHRAPVCFAAAQLWIAGSMYLVLNGPEGDFGPRGKLQPVEDVGDVVGDRPPG